MNNKRLTLVMMLICSIITVMAFLTASRANREVVWEEPEKHEPAVVLEIAEEPVIEEPVVEADERILTELNLPIELENQIDKAADIYGLPADLVRGVIWTESRGVVDADNGICYGLMQLNMEFEDSFCKGAQVDNIKEPKANILAGCWWLSEMLEWAEGDEDLALMAYNLGTTGAWRRWEAGERSTTYSETVQAAREKF